MAKNKWLTVNELAAILEKAFQAERVHIENFYVDGNKIEVGMGGTCNLEITVYEKVESDK